MKKLWISFLVSIVFVACYSSKPNIKLDQIKKQNNNSLIDFVASNQIVKVLDYAEEKQKLVFLYLQTDWCIPCQFMEKEVFSDQETARFMNKNFINYKVNMEKENGPDLTLIYESKVVPTMLFLDQKGRILKKYEGSLSNSKLLELSKEVLGEH